MSKDLAHRQILTHLASRLAQALLVVWGVTLICFVVARLLPGNPVYLMVGSQADESTVREVTRELGLDQPIAVQYWTYLQKLLVGDLGEAWTTSHPVLEDIAARFPATLELALTSLVLALAIALPLGIAAAVRPGGRMDSLSQWVSTAGAALPQFWLGLMLIYILFYRLRLFPPPMGRLPLMEEPARMSGLLLVDSLLALDIEALWWAARALVLPSLTLAFAVQAPILGLIRKTLADALSSLPILSARAFGLPWREVVFRRAMRLAFLPTLNMIGISFGHLLGGTVLVETVFSWPGLGQYALQAANASDYAAIQGVVLVSAIIYVLVYLLVDLAQWVLDPRIRAHG